ncbi:methyltransferase domain-containing protein [Longispora albida]|uniref:methyltransferase domain-containing protein n=1 Tax=Longispora albida TaxID=203523 RepID=UPI001FE1D407|nr:methyltransferase domain-containing protein [Longispora albida]
MRPNDPALYEQLAAEWWDEDGVFKMLHWLAAARARLIPPAERPGAVLVDLGCGGGLLAPHVAGKGYHHVGADIVHGSLGIAAKYGVTGVRADVSALPLASGCADVVSAGEILEHVYDLPSTVAEACRVLRPGGLVVLDTLSDTALCRFVAITLAERLGLAPRGVHDPALLVSPSRLKALFAAHGVRLRVRGLRPSLLDLLARRRAVRMVPSLSTAILYQGRGVKAW